MVEEQQAPAACGREVGWSDSELFYCGAALHTKRARHLMGFDFHVP